MSILVTDPNLAPSKTEEFDIAARIEAAFARPPARPRPAYRWSSKQSVPDRGTGGIYEAGEFANGRITLLVGSGPLPETTQARLSSELRVLMTQNRSNALLNDGLNLLFRSILWDESTGQLFAGSLFFGLVEPARKMLSYLNVGDGCSWIWTDAGGLNRLTPTSGPLGKEYGMNARMEYVGLNHACRTLLFQASYPEWSGTWVRTACEDTLHLPVERQVEAILARQGGEFGSSGGGGDITVLSVDFGHGDITPGGPPFLGPNRWETGSLDPCVYLG